MNTKAAHRKDIATGISTMEHRHFSTVAAIIRTMPDHALVKATVIEHFANRLQETNPRFDRNRFIRACVVEGN